MKIVSSILFCASLFVFSNTRAQDRLSGKTFATRSEVIARNGMVATNHPIASQIAIEVLKKGGTAVDAAIAANAFLGLADPGMNGIGGDLFAIVWDAKTKKLYGLNGSGRSPRSLTLAHLQQEEKKKNSYFSGPLSVTTPGCVDGWFMLHGRFGKLPMAELLQHTIRYAREGIPVTQEVADQFMMTEASIPRSNSNFRALYFNKDRFYRKGEIYRNPDLAGTLEIIIAKGRDGFYKGVVAEKIASYMKEVNGFLCAEDLAMHKGEWVNPISVNYRGYDVWELPPNGQGMGVLQMLAILKGFDVAKMGYGTADHLHHFIEAKKLAYEDMAMFYGDPDFGKIPIEKLLAEEYAVTRRKLISPERAGEYQPGLSSGDHTIYLTTADKDGNMVSFIQSNSALFGSLQVPTGLGFVLHNRGAGFILKEGHINTFAPGKRPFHTIIPAFVTKDSEPFMSFGLMGGDMQTQGHVQIIMNILDFGMNVQEAGDAPRVYHRGTISYEGHVPGVGDTFIESGFDYQVIRELMLKGHSIRMRPGIFGGYQAIMRKNGVYYGASESRKDGQAAGY
jgi:gamma-glutamyltranspeptidase / glutathione hydrolase